MLLEVVFLVVDASLVLSFPLLVQLSTRLDVLLRDNLAALVTNVLVVLKTANCALDVLLLLIIPTNHTTSGVDLLSVLRHKKDRNSIHQASTQRWRR